MIRFDQGIEWIYRKELKYTQLSFYGPHISKENIEDSKIMGMKRFKLLSKDNNGGFA